MRRLSVIWRAWAAPVALTVTIVAFAAGSSSLVKVKRAGLEWRWYMLYILCGVALTLVWRRRAVSPALRFAPLPGAFLLLALASTTWSVAPRTTFEKSASLGILFVTAAALAHAAVGDHTLRLRLLSAIGIGATAVACAGFVMLVAGMGEAVQRASVETPWRFRGFGENPNTVPVLAAVALPAIAWLALRRAGLVRLGWGLAFLASIGTIVATQSRGGLLAAFVGTAIVLGVLAPGRWRRVATVVMLAAVCFGGVTLRQALQPPPPGFEVARAPHVAPGERPFAPGGKDATGLGALVLPGRDQEIGDPRLSTYEPTTLGSGRVAAWGGALDLVLKRPVVGYGFGTEPIVFVDRWYYFQGGTPENSVLGVLLQLGVLGLAAIAAVIGSLVWRGARVARTATGDERAAIVVGLATLGAAAMLMLIQSYVYAVGNVATVSVWVSAFLLAGAVWRPRVAATDVGAAAAAPRHEVVGAV